MLCFPVCFRDYAAHKEAKWESSRQRQALYKNLKSNHYVPSFSQDIVSYACKDNENLKTEKKYIAEIVFKAHETDGDH